MYDNYVSAKTSLLRDIGVSKSIVAPLSLP